MLLTSHMCRATLITSHCAYVRPSQGGIVMIAPVFCCAQLRHDACVCVFAKERETLGDFPVVRKKLSSDFKGVSGQRSTSQAQMPALWGHVNFMPSNYLSSHLVISLASCSRTVFTLEYNTLWVLSNKQRP